MSIEWRKVLGVIVLPTPLVFAALPTTPRLKYPLVVWEGEGSPKRQPVWSGMELRLYLIGDGDSDGLSPDIWDILTLRKLRFFESARIMTSGSAVLTTPLRQDFNLLESVCDSTGHLAGQGGAPEVPLGAGRTDGSPR